MVRNFTRLPTLRFWVFVMYYIYVHVQAIPIYRVYQLYHNNIIMWHVNHHALSEWNKNYKTDYLSDKCNFFFSWF